MHPENTTSQWEEYATKAKGHAMIRDIYAQHCDRNCGCCEPITDQAESDDSAFLMPKNLTPEERLLWAIFGKNHPKLIRRTNNEHH